MAGAPRPYSARGVWRLPGLAPMRACSRRSLRSRAPDDRVMSIGRDDVGLPQMPRRLSDCGRALDDLILHVRGAYRLILERHGMRNTVELRRGDVARARLDQCVEQVVPSLHRRVPRHDCVNELAIERVGRSPEGAERDRVLAFALFQTDDSGRSDAKTRRELADRHIECLAEGRNPAIPWPLRA